MKIKRYLKFSKLHEDVDYENMTIEEKAKKWDELANLVLGYFNDDIGGEDYEITEDDAIGIGEYVLMQFDLM